MKHAVSDLRPNIESANIPYWMQLELCYKKEYVCKIPSRRLIHFRHILRKDNELAHQDDCKTNMAVR